MWSGFWVIWQKQLWHVCRCEKEHLSQVFSLLTSVCLGNNELPVELLSGTTCTLVVKRWALPGQITGSLEWVIECAESVGTSFTTQSRHLSPTFLSQNINFIINIGATMISVLISYLKAAFNNPNMIEICVYKRVHSSALDAGKVCSATSVDHSSAAVGVAC